MTEYVEKVQVPVRLSQPVLQPRDGHFLLFPARGSERRSESLLELLNSRRAFIPFIVAADAAVLLVTRRNIDWVAVGPSVIPSLILPLGFEPNRSQLAELRFADDTHVEATVEWYATDDGARLSDYLNSCDEFVASRTRLGTVIWNKHRIHEIRVLTG